MHAAMSTISLVKFANHIFFLCFTLLPSGVLGQNVVSDVSQLSGCLASMIAVFFIASRLYSKVRENHVPLSLHRLTHVILSLVAHGTNLIPIRKARPLERVRSIVLKTEPRSPDNLKEEEEEKISTKYMDCEFYVLSQTLEVTTFYSIPEVESIAGIESNSGSADSLHKVTCIELMDLEINCLPKTRSALSSFDLQKAPPAFLSFLRTKGLITILRLNSYNDYSNNFRMIRQNFLTRREFYSTIRMLEDICANLTMDTIDPIVYHFLKGVDANDTVHPKAEGKILGDASRAIDEIWKRSGWFSPTRECDDACCSKEGFKPSLQAKSMDWQQILVNRSSGEHNFTLCSSMLMTALLFLASPSDFSRLLHAPVPLKNTESDSSNDSVDRETTPPPAEKAYIPYAYGTLFGLTTILLYNNALISGTRASLKMKFFAADIPVRPHALAKSIVSGIIAHSSEGDPFSSVYTADLVTTSAARIVLIRLCIIFLVQIGTVLTPLAGILAADVLSTHSGVHALLTENSFEIGLFNGSITFHIKASERGTRGQKMLGISVIIGAYAFSTTIWSLSAYIRNKLSLSPIEDIPKWQQYLGFALLAGVLGYLMFIHAVRVVIYVWKVSISQSQDDYAVPNSSGITRPSRLAFCIVHGLLIFLLFTCAILSTVLLFHRGLDHGTQRRLSISLKLIVDTICIYLWFIRETSLTVSAVTGKRLTGDHYEKSYDDMAYDTWWLSWILIVGTAPFTVL